MRRPWVVFGLAAGLYVLLTIALTWPLILHPASLVPNDLGDSLLNMFILAWNARVLPFTEEWWNLPHFYPVPGATAFSEHLLGLSLFATPVLWLTGNPILAYNVAFLVSFPLCAIGAHLAGYAITRRHDVALIAGIAYAFAPYRMSQFSHVQVLSAYWIPFALLGLHRFVETGRWRWAAVFAAAWWLQALANGYLLFYLSVLVGLWLTWFVVAPRRWRDLARLTIAWAAAALALVPIALGYLKWQRAYGFKRWPDEIQSFSADIASLLSASGNLRLWGWLNVVERPESQLFPGLTVVALTLAGIAVAWAAAARSGVHRLRAPRLLVAAAVVFAVVAATPFYFGAWKLQIFGLQLLSVGTPQKPLSVALLLLVIAMAMHPSIRAGWARRSPLAFYALAAVAMWLFCLGPAPTLMNETFLYKAPYSWLMYVPGVDGVRVPARFWVLATMCLALAAALASAHVMSRWPALRGVLPGAVVVLLLVEAWPEPLLLHPAPDARPAHTRANARLELPIRGGRDLVTLYRAIEHRRPVFNGYSGYFAPHYFAMESLIREFNPEVLPFLTSFGTIEAVVDHADDGGGYYRTFLSAHPYSEVVHKGDAYTAYRLPRTTSPPKLPQLQGQSVPIVSILATPHQDSAGLMVDGDRITRWHTGGPQSPGNEVTLDLGAVRAVRGVEMQVGGYVADFPRRFTIETSEDGSVWRPGWSGSAGLIAMLAALEDPYYVPLRFALDGTPARYLRLRQSGSDRVNYWSISELRVFGG